jgi:signal transduction histidine kinase
VISGHCQRILAREEDEDNRKALGTVIRQTMRVHGILRGMMQFARPSAPQPMSTRLVDLIEDVIGELTDLTADRDVEVALEINAEIPSLIVDPGQIKTCLHHLIRNAIEASGRQGWVRVSLERRDDDGIQVVIEDNGLSPSPEQVRHLFDPVDSGRSAGRGRGLGLSIAWRLAQLHSGDVRYEPVSHGPTRFVLTLPLAVPHSLPIRKAG